MINPMATNLDALTSIPREFLSQWINNEVTKRFFEYLRADLKCVTNSIKDENELIKIGRLQGHMERLDKILALERILGPKK